MMVTDYGGGGGGGGDGLFLVLFITLHDITTCVFHSYYIT